MIYRDHIPADSIRCLSRLCRGCGGSLEDKASLAFPFRVLPFMATVSLQVGSDANQHNND